MKYCTVLLLFSITLTYSATNAQLQSFKMPHSFKYSNPVLERIDSIQKLFKGNNFIVKLKPSNKILAKIPVAKRMLYGTGCGAFCTLRALPVTGLELKGERISNTEVQLKWKTLSEYNNKGFDIERTYSVNDYFIYNGFVMGIGNSNVESRYQQKDLNDYEGTTYYRLKQTNIDGKFVYSNVIAVKGYAEPAKLKIYPNPGNTSSVYFSISGIINAEKASISITDAMGRNVYQQNNLNLIDGDIPLKQFINLPPGYYNILIISPQNNLRGSFVITQ
jgi:hypothetical protein